MSYYLRGDDGELHGLGWVVDSTGYCVQKPTYELCIGPNGVPDTACTLRNQVLNDQWGAACQAQGDKQHLADCLRSYPADVCHKQFDPGGAADATANAGSPVQGYIPAAVIAPAAPPVVAPAPVQNPVLYPGGSPGGPPTAGPIKVPAASGGAPSSGSDNSTVAGFDISGIPWWAWAGAAAVGLLFFSKGGR